MNLLGKEVYSPSEESGVIIKVWEDFVYVQFADRVEKVPLSSWSLWKSFEKWKAKDKIVECYMSMLYRKIVLLYCLECLLLVWCVEQLKPAIGRTICVILSLTSDNKNRRRYE